jgi:hypothetical protein
VTLNIIHDSRMLARLEPLMEQLRNQNITDYRIWPPVDDVNSVVASINKSHKQIIKDAMDRGLEEVAVGEDDLMFTSNNSWKYFLENKPKDYSIYLACTYIPPISNNLICGFHLYVVHSSFYETFLSIPDNVHIDTHMNETGGKWVFCYPFPALQKEGWSANNKAWADYNKVLKPSDIYK